MGLMQEPLIQTDSFLSGAYEYSIAQIGFIWMIVDFKYVT